MKRIISATPQYIQWIIQACCILFALFIPATLKSVGYYVIPFIQKIVFQCPSVCLSVRTCPRYIMRFAICTAMFSDVRVSTVWCYGVKIACGVDLTRFTQSICNGHRPLETSERPSCKYVHATDMDLGAFLVLRR